MSKPIQKFKSDYVYFESFTTRWRDNDVYGHMNNVVFYEFADSIVNNWIKKFGGLNVPESETIGLVVKTQCDYFSGLTFFFIAHALKYKNINFEAFLYDSWSKFSFDGKEDIFDYSYLSLDIVKKNLLEFRKVLTFNEGNIPEIFKNSSHPTKVDFLHIDLNSKEATLDSLNFFYEKISSDGVIIFDDYGRIDDEKEVIDKFFNNKKGNFISLPTGQAIFFKK